MNAADKLFLAAIELFLLTVATFMGTIAVLAFGQIGTYPPPVWAGILTIPFTLLLAPIGAGYWLMFTGEHKS